GGGGGGGSRTMATRWLLIIRTKTGERKSPDRSSSRQLRQLASGLFCVSRWSRPPRNHCPSCCHRSSRHGGASPWLSASAAYVIVAPSEPPDTPEIANSCRPHRRRRRGPPAEGLSARAS